MKQKFLIFSALFFLCVKLNANGAFFDNYVCQNWTSFGGLSGATATDITQTSDGYLNIGTYNGLVRFDGVEFTTLRRNKENDVDFVSVRAIFQDSKGNIWVGSNDEGVQRLSLNGNKTYTTKNGLPNNSVRAITEDKRGNVWIGTASGIVYITQDGKIITPQFEAGTIPQGIIARYLFCDTAGRVWLITANERGLFLYTDGIFRTRKELDKFGNYFVTAVNQDLLGNIWIGLAEDGIIRITNGKIVEVKTNTLLDKTPTTTIYPESNGTIWFGTERGLVVYSNGDFIEYSGTNLANANINKITGDREGNIWFATDRNGITKMTHGKFKVTKIGVPVNAIAEDTQGRIWLGTDKGVRCLAPESETEISNPLTEFTKGLRIRHIGTALNGDLLVCCYTKPAQIRYNPETKELKSWSTDTGLSGNKVRVALETSPDEIYVGTTTGLSIIHPNGNIKNIKQTYGLENEYIMCIYKDRSDFIWLGTDGGGIYIMKNERILKHITTAEGLIGNVIFKISQDLDGTYWICTGSGISRCSTFNETTFNPSTFENVNAESGLGTDSIFQVIFDTTNNVWMTSNHGISSAQMEDFYEAEKDSSHLIRAQFYNTNDGLDSKGPTSTALSICDRYGRIWFTMVDGYAIYDPVKVYENPIMPLVNIESVTVDNVEFIAPTNKAIILKPGTKRIDIKFTGLSFDAPERIQFSHKLTGFDDEFSLPNNFRTVSYTNIKPGKHTFMVNAINGENYVSETAETMLFIQKPYLYQMPLFWIIIALLLLGMTVTLFYLREQAIRKENQKLENMVRIKTADLEAEKNKSDSLLRSILPDKIAEKLKDEGIHSLGENFEDATLLFSDIVGFTKITSGHTAEEIVSALNDLFSRFDDRAKRMGVEKIKTIGDAYMAACGIPTPNMNHAKIMVDFAKGMYRDLEEYNETAKIKFSIRIGLNCGPVTAGVIGKTKFIYDVWGNTVNVASRMETACQPGKIRITENVRQHLLHTDVQFSSPIDCDIKGKGIMTTYEII